MAYESLLQVCGEPSETWPEFRRALGTFSFPEDVDWTLVRRIGEGEKIKERRMNRAYPDLLQVCRTADSRIWTAQGEVPAAAQTF